MAPTLALACGFSHTPALPEPSDSLFSSATEVMCLHINRCYVLGLIYLRRRYRKRAREYWVHPLSTVRYMEGRFYTLFEQLRNHDSKCYNYFRVSIHTFDFLVDRVTVFCCSFLSLSNSSSKLHKLLSKPLFFYFVFKTISSFFP